jgi:uncharacterized membrane protein YvbJ
MYWQMEEKSMKCSCGNRLEKGDMFCSNCGRKVIVMTALELKAYLDAVEKQKKKDTASFGRFCVNALFILVTIFFSVCILKGFLHGLGVM